MSKALVIKGANFSVNKVETIEISEPIPCTGITLSQASFSSIALGTEVTLTATVVPVDTTETVVWNTSDANVATVENGVVTITGVGTATITATCGTQSANCSVSSTVVIVVDDLYTAENGYRYSNSMDLNAGKNHIGRGADAASRLYWSATNITDGYRAFFNTQNDGRYVIPIPTGAEKIEIDAPVGLRKICGFAIANSKQKQTYVGGADGQSAMGLKGGINWNVPSWPYVIDLRGLLNADGFIFSVSGESGVDPSEVSGKTTVTFGYYTE